MAELLHHAYAFYAYAALDRPTRTLMTVTPIVPETPAFEALRKELLRDAKVERLEREQAFKWAIPKNPTQLLQGSSEVRRIRKQTRRDSLALRARSQLPARSTRDGELRMTLGPLARIDPQLHALMPLGRIEAAQPLMHQTVFDRWEVRQFVLELAQPQAGEAYAFTIDHVNQAANRQLGRLSVAFIPGYPSEN
jgi:hypothetical protein